MDERIIVLNDQGGGVMNVSDKANTLRAQDHGHPPVICSQANGIDRCDTAGCNGCGWNDSGVSYTLNTIDRHAVCYDSRGNGEGVVCPTLTGDHENRITDYTALLIMDMTRRDRVDVNPPEKAPTMQAAMGTGGGNVPVILMEAVGLDGCEGV